MQNLRDSKLWIVSVLAVICALIFFFDPASKVSERESGNITYSYPIGRFAAGYASVKVRLKDSTLVIADFPLDGKYPYPNGTSVEVTVFESLIFGRRTYLARPI